MGINQQFIQRMKSVCKTQKFSYIDSQEKFYSYSMYGIIPDKTVLFYDINIESFISTKMMYFLKNYLLNIY